MNDLFGTKVMADPNGNTEKAMTDKMQSFRYLERGCCLQRSVYNHTRECQRKKDEKKDNMNKRENERTRPGTQALCSLFVPRRTAARAEQASVSR